MINGNRFAVDGPGRPPSVWLGLSASNEKSKKSKKIYILPAINSNDLKSNYSRKVWRPSSSPRINFGSPFIAKLRKKTDFL